MRRERKSLAAVLVPALLLPLWACGSGDVVVREDDRGDLVITGVDDDPPTTPTAPASPEPPSTSVEYAFKPEVIQFEHKVGETPCPQRIGTITIKNGKNRIRMSLRDAADARPIAVEPETWELLPGETLKVAVYFDCDVVAPVTKILTFEFRDPKTGARTVSQVTVIGDVHL